jgi:glycolate oxidase iron-sulfur subunit
VSSVAPPPAATAALADAIGAQKDRLVPCVHCGFCLPACPTYTRLGDEADSPRGRLHLMKAVVEGRLDPGSEAFRTHIDRCLGCRACEPVCPSGVEYGTLLELARHTAAAHVPQGWLTRGLLWVMASRGLRGALFFGGRLLRGIGLAALGAKLVPPVRSLREVRLGLAMLAATGPGRLERVGRRQIDQAAPTPSEPSAGHHPARSTVGLLVGCVQDGLYSRINDATARTLEANGFEVVTVDGQDCCGALHAHGGDLERARSLARGNIDAFLAAGVEQVVVNAAGCGAAMKDYGTLLEHDAEYVERARRLAGIVKDVTELLAAAGPRMGASVETSVAYDHPCHLLHAQRIEQAPLDVLAAVPGLEVRVVTNAAECCGGAGIYGITHPDLGGRIGADKVAAVRAEGAVFVTTPNPGCMMQIGAGLRLEGSGQGVVHPVELLDESYRRAGYYEGTET